MNGNYQSKTRLHRLPSSQESLIAPPDLSLEEYPGEAVAVAIYGHDDTQLKAYGWAKEDYDDVLQMWEYRY